MISEIIKISELFEDLNCFVPNSLTILIYDKMREKFLNQTINPKTISILSI